MDSIEELTKSLDVSVVGYKKSQVDDLLDFSYHEIQILKRENEELKRNIITLKDEIRSLEKVKVADTELLEDLRNVKGVLTAVDSDVHTVSKSMYMRLMDTTNLIRKDELQGISIENSIENKVEVEQARKVFKEKILALLEMQKECVLKEDWDTFIQIKLEDYI